ncbi:META domain-containing protein [Chryseobacterium sp. SL1]|uniref:META domain-containing protein n=1 Tax=Chryseobacterium sp. SL1 TaxID=2995159 RepID=UPI002274641C|nr:META domain-containing protein [Chryseobacterium sp. SL1]MCY1659366.1 META domain-containing protein [Chryseobacterium sp. SL1]
MKKRFIAILTFLCLSFILNCSSVAVKNPQIQREWMLVSFADYSKEELIKNNAKIDLTSPADNGKIKTSAFMGCNKMFFTTEFKKENQLHISEVTSTEMACPNMKLENDFSQNIKKMKDYKVEGHFLILNDDQGNRMKFIASDWD